MTRVGGEAERERERDRERERERTRNELKFTGSLSAERQIVLFPWFPSPTQLRVGQYFSDIYTLPGCETHTGEPGNHTRASAT